MLLKPDKLPSLATSYRPISLISSIMKLFKRIIEQRLRSHVEQIGFINKHQSDFRRAKSIHDHLFRLSQSIIKNFNRGEHTVASFLDVEKAFDNVWHNGLRYKILQLDLPTKRTRWLYNFLVGHAILVNVNGFLSDQINPKAGVWQGSVLSPLLFWFTSTTFQHRAPQTKLTIPIRWWYCTMSLQLKRTFCSKTLQQDVLNLAKWCEKWRIQGDHIQHHDQHFLCFLKCWVLFSAFDQSLNICSVYACAVGECQREVQPCSAKCSVRLPPSTWKSLNNTQLCWTNIQCCSVKMFSTFDRSLRKMIGAWLLSHRLPQKLLFWQAGSVSIISRWRCANLAGANVSEVRE